MLAAPGRSAADQVTDTLDRFSAALAERRGEDACADLTRAARRGVEQRTGTLDCAATLRTFGLGLDASALRAGRIVRVTVAGTRAVIEARDLLAPSGRPVGPRVTFERDGDEWRIATLLGA